MQIDKKHALHKTSYEIFRKLVPIYSGGNVELGLLDENLYTIYDESINILDVRSGDSTRIDCGIGQITCLALSSSGTSLACASRKSLISLWNTQKCEKIRDWRALDSIILSMAFNSSSRLLSIAASDGIVQVWDVVRNICTHNLKGHSGLVTCVRFHPDPAVGILASCSNDNTVRIWELITNKKVVLSEHKSTVVRIAFACSGKYIVSCGRDNLMVIWEVETRKKLRVIIFTDTFESIVIVPPSSPLYDKTAYNYSHKPLACTLGAAGTIRMWDLLSGCLVSEHNKDSTIKTSSINVSISGNYLISTSAEHDISLHNFDSDLTKICTKIGSPADILSIAPLSNSNPDFIAVATSSNFLRLCNTITKECVTVPGHSSLIMCVVNNPNANFIATGGKDDKILIWKYEIINNEGGLGYESVRCSLYACCTGHTDTVNALSWAKKSNNVLLSTGADRTVKLWTLKNNKNQKAEHPQLSANYTILVHEKEVQGLDTSNNGKFFATASSDKTAKLWGMSTGELLGTFRGHTRGLWCIKFSTSDQYVATGSTDKTIKLWNVNDFTCINTFEGHLNSVVDIIFISGGSQIVSCGLDGLIKIWDVNNSTCQKTLSDNEDRIWALSAIRDGEFLISGSSDENIFIWKDVTQEEELLKTKQREDLILLKQDLSNMMHQKNYRTSIKLLLRLEHQINCFTLFQELLEPSNNEQLTVSSALLRDIVTDLDNSELSTLLLYCRNWNTNWRYVNVAQTVLSCVINCVPLDRIAGLKNASTLLTIIKDYSESHYKSIDELHTGLCLIDYLVSKSVGFEMQNVINNNQL